MKQRYLRSTWVIPLALGCQFCLPHQPAAEQLRIVEAPPLTVESAQGAPAGDAQQEQQAPQQTFAIGRFVITGSDLFSDSDLQEQLRQFTGRNRTAADREAARYALERFFHDQGYRAVTVSLPEQPPGDRVVRLLVNENRAAMIGTDQPLSAATQPTLAAVPAGEAPVAHEPPAGEEPAKTAKQAEPAEQEQQTFTIRRFAIEGTALFPAEELQRQLRQYVGRGRTAADVEGARDVLERFFHDQGYPTVMVNIPEQSVQNKVIRLEVIENRVGTVTLTGNTWFSTEKIMAELPSLAPGQVLKLQDLQLEVNRINRNPDFKVIPDMQPGKTPETVDLNLKVEDNLPLHGSLEINNRSSHDTTATRLLASLRYDNLWQRDHSLSAQYQISPQNTSQVQVASGSYSLPAPWDRDDKIVLYCVWSNSDTTSVGDYKTIGKGYILGTRVIVPLRAIGDYNHTAVLGFDYKDFEETGGLLGSNGLKTPVSYSPLSLAYNAVMRDEGGQTSFNSAVNMSFRGAVANERQFEEKRYKSLGNYIVMTAGLERTQKLPADFTLLVKVDGQVADQPLIANEQYTAGGMESVRGYRESEASGDSAVHGVLELAAPNLLKKVGNERYALTPYLFYDFASLWIRNPLPRQAFETNLQGTGIGLRGLLFGRIDFQTDLGYALKDTTRIKAGDALFHFKVRYQF